MCIPLALGLVILYTLQKHPPKKPTDELFEVAGDELERRISMAMEVEQLRRDSSRRPSALFEGIVGRPSSPGPGQSALKSTGAGGAALEPDASVRGGTPGGAGVDDGDVMMPDFGADMLPDVAPFGYVLSGIDKSMVLSMMMIMMKTLFG